MLAIKGLSDLGLAGLAGGALGGVGAVIMSGAGKLHDVTHLGAVGRGLDGSRSAGRGHRGLDSGAVPVKLPGINPPIIRHLALKGLEVPVEAGIFRAGGVIDADLAVLPPKDHEVAPGSPQARTHKGNKIIALFEHFKDLFVIGVVRLAIGLGPVQHITVNAKLRKLGLEITVIGAVAQGLVTVGHAPVAGVLWGVLLAGHGFDNHGRRRRTTAGAADGGTFALDPVGLGFPAGVSLEVGNGFLVHDVISSFSLSARFQPHGGRCPPHTCPQSG